MKLGVLGGTFDPFHLGHVEMALSVRRALGLDAVHLVPCRLPPHKARPLKRRLPKRYGLL